MIWTLDYLDYFVWSQRIWMIKVRLYLQLKYTVSMPEKIMICLNRGCKELVGNDDIFYCLRWQVQNG